MGNFQTTVWIKIGPDWHQLRAYDLFNKRRQVRSSLASKLNPFVTLLCSFLEVYRQLTLPPSSLTHTYHHHRTTVPSSVCTNLVFRVSTSFRPHHLLPLPFSPDEATAEGNVRGPCFSFFIIISKQVMKNSNKTKTTQEDVMIADFAQTKVLFLVIYSRRRITKFPFLLFCDAEDLLKKMWLCD